VTDRHEEPDKVPSLLERESRGGDVAEGGFAFQESVVMSYVPVWLAHEGFEEMTQESMGDAEAKFFVPGRPLARELVEVKNHRVVPAEFWKEVGRFRDLDEGSPDTFHRFVLVGKELGEDIKRLKNGLERVRGPHSFYDETPIETASFAVYAEMVIGMGHSKDEARFLFERVEIRDDLTTDQVQWRGVFTGELFSHFPEYEELPGRIVGDVYEGLGDLLRSLRNRSISRKEIERRILGRVPVAKRPPVRPVVVRTSIGDEREEAGPEIRPIRLDWKDFYGGSGRFYPLPAEWDDRLIGELRQTKEWILRHRSTRRVRLIGNRRLSAALAVGAVFSAVAGFVVEMEVRGGQLWATDAYPTEETPSFPVSTSGEVFACERLVVSVGVMRDISGAVEESLDALGLAGAPTLHLHSDEAVRSAEHANKAAKILKETIVEMLWRCGGTRVELFFAGPAFLAMALGHGVNAVAPVRCHEWGSGGSYVPTCELPS
jgi:SMODS-associated and fused to various effectors sensor domain